MPKKPARRSTRDEHDKGNRTLADERTGQAQVAGSCPGEDAVETIEEPAQQAAALLARPQQAAPTRRDST